MSKTKLLAIILLCALTAFMVTGCSRWYTDYGINKGQLRSREILPQLIQALDDQKPRTRREALHHISRLKLSAQEAIPKVVELAKTDTDEKTRHYAIKVLRLIMPNNPENIELMKEVANCNSGDLAVEAENTLSSIERQDPTDPTLENLNKINIADGIEIKLTPEFLFYNGYVTIQPSRSTSMLPIEIEISNQTNAPLNLDSRCFTLLDSEGEQKSQLPVEAAIKRQQYDIGAAVLRGLVILGPIPAVKAGRANGIISKFCEAKVLTTLEVKPGEQLKKTIFFNCPSRPTQVSGWQLDFSCQQKNCGKKINLHHTFGVGVEITTEQITPQPQLAHHLPTPLSLESKLTELKVLKDKNLITEEEYVEKRRLLIEEF